MRYAKVKSKFSISFVLFYSVIILLIISFLFSFSGGANFTIPSYVIKVGNSKVTKQEWISLIHQNNIYQKDLSKIQLQNKMYQLSNELVMKYVLFEEAKNIGIKVTDNMVKKEILKMPYFYRSGKFSHELFEQILKNYGVSESDFLKDIKVNLTIQKFYLSSFLNQNTVLPSILDNLMEAFLKTREVRLLNIPFSAFNISTPTLEELSRIYTHVKPVKHAQINISYAIIDPTINLKNTVSEKNLYKVYEASKQLLQTEEKRDISQIYFSSLNNAKKAYKEINSGVNFMAIAKKYSPEFNNINLYGAKFTDFDSETASNIFKLGKGKYSEPIDTSLGIYIFKIDNITLSTIKPYNQLKDKIKSVVIQEEKEKKLAEYLSDIKFLKEEKNSFNEIIKKYKLKVFHEDVLNDGKNIKLQGNVNKSVFRDFLFANDKKIENISYENNEYILIKKNNVIPSKLEEFKNVQNKMREIYINKKLSLQAQKVEFDIKGEQIYLAKQKKDKILDANMLSIKSLTLHGNKENNKLPIGLLPILHRTKLKELSTPFIDYKKKMVSFLVFTQELRPLKSEKFKMKGLYNKAIAEMESLDLQGALKSRLIKKYKDKIDNKIVISS